MHSANRGSCVKQKPTGRLRFFSIKTFQGGSSTPDIRGAPRSKPTCFPERWLQRPAPTRAKREPRRAALEGGMPSGSFLAACGVEGVAGMAEAVDPPAASFKPKLKKHEVTTCPSTCSFLWGKMNCKRGRTMDEDMLDNLPLKQ